MSAAARPYRLLCRRCGRRRQHRDRMRLCTRCEHQARFPTQRQQEPREPWHGIAASEAIYWLIVAGEVLGQDALAGLLAQRARRGPRRLHAAVANDYRWWRTQGTREGRQLRLFARWLARRGSQ